MRLKKEEGIITHKSETKVRAIWELVRSVITSPIILVMIMKLTVARLKLLENRKRRNMLR
jgi:hypothetical protein